MDNKIRHTEMFKIGFYKIFCNIALLISVAALMVCRSRLQSTCPAVSVTGMGFSLDTRNVGAFPKLIKICGKLSINMNTGLRMRLLDLVAKI